MCGEKECTIYFWKERKLYVPFAPFFPKGKNLVTKLNFSPIQIHKDRLRRGCSFLPLHLLVTIPYQYSWILNVYFKKNSNNFLLISNPFHKYLYLIYTLPGSTKVHIHTRLVWIKSIIYVYISATLVHTRNLPALLNTSMLNQTPSSIIISFCHQSWLIIIRSL
jgi:hypothetical protein